MSISESHDRGTQPVAAATEVLRYTAFSAHPDGGNPAGVVLDAAHMTAGEMLTTAAEVGFSETAFLVPRGDRIDVRYFSPRAEVSFCGHATIASAVAYAERHGAGRLLYSTPVGPVEVVTSASDGGSWRATLTSVPPRTISLEAADRAALLDALRWSEADLDPALPPRVAYAAPGTPSWLSPPELGSAPWTTTCRSWPG
jgi:PhzF family phenazine biosynthesis protein